MKYLRLILRRPASVILIIIAVLVFGTSSLAGMPLEYMPDMEMPMELVVITWPGTDADSIERLVTEKVEDECETLSGINSITSETYDNYMMIGLQYDYSADMDDAYSDLKSAMDNLAADLPDGCGEPSIMEISMDFIPTMTLSAVSSDGGDIQSYLNDTVVPALESISGVAQVELSGATDEYLRIELNEAKLDQYGLTISTVGNAIAAADFDIPLGNVSVGSQDIALTATGDTGVSTIDLRQVPIQTPTGQIVHLMDVCSAIELSHKEADSISRYNGADSMLLSITKSDSASTIAVCGEVEEVLAGFDSVDFQTVYSEKDSVIENLIAVIQTLAVGVVLTMLVLFVFFGNVRASLIVGCSMPLSILIAAMLLSLKGFAFDMMTGTSLIIAIGMIVDNSIVVLESCMRIHEEGTDFKEAAIQGTGSVLMSIFASTLTTVVVYVPLAMADGMSGQMSEPLSWTIGLTLTASFICAVTVVPLVFSMVKPEPKKDLPINRLLSSIQKFYRRTMPSLLRHPGRVLAASVAILAASLLLLTQMEFVLMPTDYDGSIQVDVGFRAGTRLEIMDASIQELEAALLSDENFDQVTLSLSGSTATFTAYAVDGCRRSSEDAATEYTQRFRDVAGMDVSATPMTSSEFGSMMSNGNAVEVTLVSNSLTDLQDGAAMVEEAMIQAPGVIRVDTPFSASRTQGKLVIDAQKALAAGVSQASAAMQIRYLLSGMTATTIDYGDQEYDVILEYPEGTYEELYALLDRPISTQTGGRVTIGELADIEYSTSLPSLSRQDGQFVATLTATATTETRDQAKAAIDASMASMTLPVGVTEGQTSMDKMSDDETSGMTTTMLTAVFLVFLVMAVQFNSPKLSLMVMLCIPFSLAGSFGAVFLTGRPMSVLGLMGFLMLFGIVVNNGILLVDAAGVLRQTMPLGEALVQAGVTRLRPILMTTLTTILSMVPMIFSSESGMIMMREIAIIIIGGLVASTILTLFLMPPFYLLIRGETVTGERRRDVRRRKREAKKPALAAK